MRRGGLVNGAQLSGMVATAVGGGENADGNWSLMAGFCGPGPVLLLGFVALIAPWAGRPGCRRRPLPSRAQPRLRSPLPSQRRRPLSPTPPVSTSFSLLLLVWPTSLSRELRALPTLK